MFTFTNSKTIYRKSSIINKLKLLFKYNIIGDKIRLEACNICQLSCPCCSNKRIKDKGFLKFKDFKQFIDANPKIKKVELSNWGEIFLNPELETIIEYAYKQRIALSANNGVNLNCVIESMLEALVKYNFFSMSISIDGATQDTYKIYRQGGSFNVVLENIKKINHFKEQYRSKFPYLTWKFIAFGHNQHELSMAEKMSEDLKMQFVTKLNHSPNYSPIKNSSLLRQYLKFLSIEEYEAKTGKPYETPCLQLWTAPQINWDGELLGCCINKDPFFGNVFEQGLAMCLKSENYRYAKKMILGIAKPKKHAPCYSCKYFQKLNKQPIFRKYLRKHLRKKAFKYFLPFS